MELICHYAGEKGNILHNELILKLNFTDKTIDLAEDYKKIGATFASEEPQHGNILF